MIVLEQFVLKSRGGSAVLAFSDLSSAKKAQRAKASNGITLALVRQVMTEEAVYEA